MKLGKAFSDNIIASSIRRVHIKDQDRVWWRGAGRALLFASVFCLAFFALTIRLVHLTVLRGHELRALADGNRTREIIRNAPRGILFDRTGKPLVVNQGQYRLVRPCEGKALTPCTETLSKEEGEQWEKEGLPAGFYLEVDYHRQYPYGAALAHLLGYTGELTQKELQQEYFQLRQYRGGDRMGRMGGEAVFEEKLHGRNGKELVEVDAGGKTLRILGRDPEVAGESVMLSVDADLSKAVVSAFPEGFKGVVVVAKPTTGEILALYSSPSFDPNKFSSGLTQKEYDDLAANPDQPLFFRAIGGVYPPGSTFKIVTAIGALQEGAIAKDTIIEDNGTITIGPYQFSNWYFSQYGKTEGPVDIVKGLQRSNDIFFYKTGERLGVTKLADWARKVGIGKPLGIELGGEAGGLMPDPAWKNQRFTTALDLEARNNEWYLGDTYHLSIGQGYLLTTPLQVNTWTNVIANGGKLCRPTIEKVKSPASPAGRQKSKVKSECKDLGIKKETIALITEGMRKACEPGGTGWPLFNFRVKSKASQKQDEQNKEATDSSLLTRPAFDSPPVSVPVACKTGTAEFGDPQDRTHAWFTVFAPLTSDGTQRVPQNMDNQGLTPITGEPEISVTVLVEGGGEGSSVAAPIAKKILESWFAR